MKLRNAFCVSLLSFSALAADQDQDLKAEFSNNSSGVALFSDVQEDPASISNILFDKYNLIFENPTLIKQATEKIKKSTKILQNFCTNETMKDKPLKSRSLCHIGYYGNLKLQRFDPSVFQYDLHTYVGLANEQYRIVTEFIILLQQGLAQHKSSISKNEGESVDGLLLSLNTKFIKSLENVLLGASAGSPYVMKFRKNNIDIIELVEHMVDDIMSFRNMILGHLLLSESGDFYVVSGDGSLAILLGTLSQNFPIINLISRNSTFKDVLPGGANGTYVTIRPGNGSTLIRGSIEGSNAYNTTSSEGNFSQSSFPTQEDSLSGPTEAPTESSTPSPSPTPTPSPSPAPTPSSKLKPKSNVSGNGGTVMRILISAALNKQLQQALAKNLPPQIANIGKKTVTLCRNSWLCLPTPVQNNLLTTARIFGGCYQNAYKVFAEPIEKLAIFFAESPATTEVVGVITNVKPKKKSPFMPFMKVRDALGALGSVFTGNNTSKPPEQPPAGILAPAPGLSWKHFSFRSVIVGGVSLAINAGERELNERIAHFIPEACARLVTHGASTQLFWFINKALNPNLGLHGALLEDSLLFGDAFGCAKEIVAAVSSKLEENKKSQATST